MVRNLSIQHLPVQQRLLVTVVRVLLLEGLRQRAAERKVSPGILSPEIPSSRGHPAGDDRRHSDLGHLRRGEAMGAYARPGSRGSFRCGPPGASDFWRRTSLRLSPLAKPLNLEP
jgi:hypothetical protein